MQFRKAHLALLLPILLIVGCQAAQEEPLSIPKGWDGNSIFWWQIGADTTGAYRPLETMDEMGVPGSHLLSASLDGRSVKDSDLAQRKFNQYVKESLIELFRNQPEVVDSLFDKFVLPKMEGLNLEGDVQPLIKKHQREAYRVLARHFRSPRTLTKLGRDIPVVVPDSLKEQQLSGKVFLQVALNKEGVPVALNKIEGLHPTLDRIAMLAITEMRWQTAYLLKGGKSNALPSWVRMKVRFGPQ